MWICDLVKRLGRKRRETTVEETPLEEIEIDFLQTGDPKDLFDPENILKAAKYEYRTHHRREYQEDTVNNLIIEYFFNPETKEFKIGGLAERGDYAMVQFVDDKGKVYGGLGAYRVLKVEAGRTVIDRNDEVFQADRTVIDREINPIVQRYNRGVEFR